MKAKWHRWMGLGCVLVLIFQGCSQSAPQDEGKNPTALASLLAMPTNELAHVDIARVNLLCAQGLPGCETVDVTNSLGVLDQWAARVKSETERHNYRWERNPAEFEHSKGFFKMLILGVVLAEDFKVHYRKDRQVSPDAASINDGFFGDARDVFLPGLLSEQRQGTCSSMPVLYVAVGRRLGCWCVVRLQFMREVIALFETMTIDLWPSPRGQQAKKVLCGKVSISVLRLGNCRRE